MGSSCQTGEASSSWVLNNPLVTFEQMTMLLRQVQACLNSLPLYAFSDNPEDLSHHIGVNVGRDDAAMTLSVAIRSTEITTLLEAMEPRIPKSTADVTKVHSSTLPSATSSSISLPLLLSREASRLELEN
jgi:hypothetical protein